LVTFLHSTHGKEEAVLYPGLMGKLGFIIEPVSQYLQLFGAVYFLLVFSLTVFTFCLFLSFISPTGFKITYNIAIATFILFIIDFIRVKIISKLERIPPPNSERITIDAILKRKSIRSYQKKPLTSEHRRLINDEIKRVTANTEVRIQLVQKKMFSHSSYDPQEFMTIIIPKKYHTKHIIDAG
jgi:hypothetical protein